MGSAPRLLLVEDDELCRDMLTRRLCHRGRFQCVEAQDGLQALAYAINGGVDLILLDLVMPHLDGFEVVRRIRALPPPRGTVPIVMLSAYPAEQHAEQARQVGCAAFVQKPVDFKHLVEVISQLLSPY